MSKLFNWRDEIRKTSLPPTTRLVLFNLSFYMNGYGDNCYPSLSRQEKDTGLSRRAIIQHLKNAVDAGYLKVEKSKEPNAKWEHNKYYPAVPEHVKGSEPSAPPSSKVVTLTTQGGYSHDTKGVHEGNTNTSYNNTDIIQSEFETLWQKIPNKTGKPKSLQAYKKAIKSGVSHKDIEAGLDYYLAYLKKNKDWLKPCGGYTWFYNERWNDDYSDFPRSEFDGRAEVMFPFGTPVPEGKRNSDTYFAKYRLVYGKPSSLENQQFYDLPKEFIETGLTKKEREG